MVNPAVARNNKGSSDITGDGVLVIIVRRYERVGGRGNARRVPSSPAAHAGGMRRMNTVILLTLLYMRQSKRGERRVALHWGTTREFP